MIFSIKYSTIAKKDLWLSANYINTILQNTFAGNRLRIEVQSAVKTLKIFPYKHPIIDEPLLLPYNIRFLAIKNYLLFYTVIEETKTIYIIRFLYARSDWQHILHYTVQYDEYFVKTTGGYVHEDQEEYNDKQFVKEPAIMTESTNKANHPTDFDEDAARQELRNELQKGLDDIAAGRTIPAEEVHAKLDKIFERYKFK